ncbi:hypothetical protein AURDEDRAFT_169817 [Auricularia subglabra TFB-10046 SS5]|nr:hypothetical protein AURDEDRAFT_169817 [Auricularia subglabra TFB-10046 SS5]
MATFEDLIYTVLSCKTVHAVFASTPRTILKAVAQNTFGSIPIATAALRAIRVEEALAQTDGTETVLSTALLAVGRDEAFEITLAPRYLLALHKRAEVGRRLEVCYSHTFKNTTVHNSSLLTLSESSLFHIALHGVWLTSFLSTRDFEDTANIGALALPDPTSPPIKWFIASLSPEESPAFRSVWRWLAWLCDAASASQPMPVFPGLNPDWIAGCIALRLGPAGVLDIIESPDYRQALLDARKTTDFHSHALQHLLDAAETQEHLTTEQAIAPFTYGVLSFDGLGKKCEKCGLSGRYPFWNRDNWSHLPLPLRALSPKHLPRGLYSNKYEMSLVQEHLVTQSSSMAGEHGELHADSYFRPVGKLIEDLFRLQDAEPLVSRGHKFEDAHITEDSLLCAPCLGSLIRGRFWAWWLVEKDSRPGAFARKPDCRHGYDCKLQALPWKDEHREKFNHACPPHHQDLLAAKLASDRKRAKRAAAKRAAKAQKRVGDGPSNTETPAQPCKTANQTTV